MGVAAYWRGSKAISDGLARDAYQEGRSWYNPDAPKAKPKPRPEGWGDKTAARAAELVNRRLAVAQKIAEVREEAFVWTTADTEAAIEQMAERYHLSKKSLRIAFAAALAQPPPDAPPLP